MLDLYHWEPTFNSGEPILLLKEKGIGFDSRYVDLLKLEQHRPPFLKINPRGEVPVLVHDGRTITETSLMLLYIEAAFPEKSLMPKAAEGRYRVHVWSKYADEYLAPAIAMIGWHEMMFPKLKGQIEAAREGLARLPPERQAVWKTALDDSYTPEQIAAAKGRLDVRLKRLEDELAGARYLAGDAYSVADIMVFFLARALPALVPDDVNERKTPHIMEWLSKVEARPAVRAALALARTEAPERQFAPGPEVPRWG